MEWLFSTNEGRRQLADNAKFQRLVVIHLGRDHKFADLKTVQDELGGVVSNLQPEGLPPNTQVVQYLCHHIITIYLLLHESSRFHSCLSDPM